MLLSPILMFAPTTAQARGFGGGGHSFHTSPHITSPHIRSPHTGGGHSFHTTPRVKSPSMDGGKSYHTPKSPSIGGDKSYHAPSNKGRISKSPRAVTQSGGHSGWIIIIAIIAFTLIRSYRNRQK